MDNDIPEIYKRMGTFSVGYRERTEGLMRALMTMHQHIVVLRAEYMAMTGEIVYHAISPAFDVVPEGQIIPTYLCLVSETQDDYTPEGVVVDVQFVRQ